MIPFIYLIGSMIIYADPILIKATQLVNIMKNKSEGVLKQFLNTQLLGKF